MNIFSYPISRPGVPYRDTETAIYAAIVTFIASLIGSIHLLGNIRPDLSAGSWDHIKLIGTHTQLWVDLIKQYPIRGGGWYLLVLGIPICLSITTFMWANRLIDPYLHVRGRRLRIGKEARRAAKIASTKAINEGGEGLEVTQDLMLSWRQEAQSFLIAGVQGAGKTVVINNILQGAINRNDKMVVFDAVKGDYTSIIPSSKKAISRLLSPWDERGHYWAIGRDLSDFSDASAFALGIIPESDDPMWSNAARGILIAGILFLIDQNGYGKWGWRELAAYCSLPVEDQKLIVDSYYPPASSSVADAESKTVQSIKINLDAFLGPIWDLARRSASKEAKGEKYFSLSEFLNDDASVVRRVIIHGNAADPVLTGAFGRAITEYMVSRIAGLAFTESKTRRIWFFLDEILQLGRLACIARLLEIGRSKGVACVFAVQTIDQVRQVYPAHEAEKWMGLFGIKIFPRIKGTSSQEWVVKEVGVREVERRTRNVSSRGNKSNVSDSWQRLEIPVILPSELETLIGPVKGGIDALVLGHGKDALVLHFPFDRLSKLREGFIPSNLPTITANPKISQEEAARLLGINTVNAIEIAELPLPVGTDDMSCSQSVVAMPVTVHQINESPTIPIKMDEVTELADFLMSAPLEDNDQLKPDESTETLEEVEDSVMGHEVEEVVAEAMGISGAVHAIEAIQEITPNEPDSFQLPDEQPIRRKRKSRYSSAEVTP